MEAKNLERVVKVKRRSPLIFQAKLKRTYWVNVIYSLIPDTIIGVAVSAYTDSGFLGFGLTVIGLQIVYFVIWLKDSLWSWALFKFRGRKIMVDVLEDCLKINKFPAPKDYETSIEDYFSSVSENEELDPSIRIKAGMEIGVLQFLITNQKVQESLRLTIAYEEALSNYKKHLQGNRQIL